MPDDITRYWEGFFLKVPGALLAHHSRDFQPRQLQLDSWWEALPTISTGNEIFICFIRQLCTFRDFHTLALHHYLLLETPKIPSRIWSSTTTRNRSESFARTRTSRWFPRKGHILVWLLYRVKALYLTLTNMLRVRWCKKPLAEMHCPLEDQTQKKPHEFYRRLQPVKCQTHRDVSS